MPQKQLCSIGSGFPFGFSLKPQKMGTLKPVHSLEFLVGGQTNPHQNRVQKKTTQPVFHCPPRAKKKVNSKQNQRHIYIYVPVPGPRTPPPPPRNGMVPPLPPHHPHLGDDAGNAGDAVHLSPREPTRPRLSQHPTLNQTTLQPLLNPNPKPKSTQTPNPPETHRKPTANQP